VSGYVPRRSDIVWLSFEPQAGDVQAGRRPAFEPVGRSHPAVRACQIYSPSPRASAPISPSSAENKIRIGAQQTSQS
jgi:Growth inhibitor